MSSVIHAMKSSDRKPVADRSFVALIRRAATRGGELLIRAANASAEARMHQARIEAELYRNRYIHSTKNDDELPIDLGTEPAPNERPWRDFAGAVVRIAKRAYPAVLVLSLLSTILAGTAAIWLAIWLLDQAR